MNDVTHKIVDIKVINGFMGVLFIGDPMLGPHRRVGRSDNAWDAGLKKLERSLDLAKSNKWLPVIVGDILHDAREISQLLPLIELLKDRKAILMPRNTRWQERNCGHLAAILQASGIASVAGVSANRYQINMNCPDGIISFVMDAHTPWGGHTRLDPGTAGYFNVPAMDVTIKGSSSLPSIDVNKHSEINAGRLLRLSPNEQDRKIQVFSLNVDGMQAHTLEVMPIVFNDSADSALNKKIDLTRDSLFVDKLRASTQEQLEDEGKSGLIDLISGVRDELKSDEWIEEMLLSLAKEAVEG